MREESETLLDTLHFDPEFIDYADTLSPNLKAVLTEVIDKLKGRIGISVKENSYESYESMSDGARYMPIMDFFSEPKDSDSPEVAACKRLINQPLIRIIDACAGEQKAINALLKALKQAIELHSTQVSKVILDLYDKNLDPSLLTSKYEMPSKSFELEHAQLKDAKEAYERKSEEPTLTFISYSDLYNTQADYARMIVEALKTSDILVVLPGTFSLFEDEIIPRIIYKTPEGFDTFLLR